MRVLAIDPGPERSGVVLWDGRKVLSAEAEQENDVIPSFADGTSDPDFVVFEKVESFGMSVGASVFETVFQTGRMFERMVAWKGRRVSRLPRKTVKMHLCGSMRAKDANIRQALIDRFGPVGTKKKPGVLYGVKSHGWAALALAVTFYDLEGAK